MNIMITIAFWLSLLISVCSSQNYSIEQTKWNILAKNNEASRHLQENCAIEGMADIEDGFAPWQAGTLNCRFTEPASFAIVIQHKEGFCINPCTKHRLDNSFVAEPVWQQFNAWVWRRVENRRKPRVSKITVNLPVASRCVLMVAANCTA